jgi:hypothetical protein
LLKIVHHSKETDKSKSEEEVNMEKFEYKVVTYDTKGFWGGKVEISQIEDQLNLIGNDGWEMVSCTSTNQSYGSSRSIVCIFKRKKDQ